MTKAFFDASVAIEVGDGAQALFWEDNWLAGCSVKHLAPNLRCHLAEDRALLHGPGGTEHESAWFMLGHGYYARSDSTCYRPVPYYLGPGAECEVVRGARQVYLEMVVQRQYSSASAYSALFLGRMDILRAHQI
jgi:hypothetical protein